MSKYEHHNIKRGVYILNDNYTYNPLLKFPRNNPCFCGSGVKYKKCCLDKQPRTVFVAEAVRIRDMLRGLVA